MSSIRALVILFVVIINSYYVYANQKQYCSALKPVKNISMDKLEGQWITLNELMFKEGIAAAPSQGDTVRHNQCVQHDVTLQVGKKNQQQLTWSPIYSFLRGHESKGSPFIVTNRRNGRWRVHDQSGAPIQGRMFILEGEPDTYLVRAMCFPEKDSTKHILKAITVESRRKPGQQGRGSLDAEKLLEVKGRLAKLLNLSEFKPAQFGLFC